MVGRLVEQQDVGRGRQHAREGGAARFAAGELRGIFLAGEPELFQDRPRLMRIVAGREPGQHIIMRRGNPRKSGSCGR